MKLKFILISLLISIITSTSYSQIDVNSTIGLPRVANLEVGNNAVGTDNTVIINETAANIGNIVYNTTNNLVYRYDGTNWIPNNEIDDDWLVANSTNIPTNVNQSIFTLGSVAIGTNNPERTFHIAGSDAGIRLDRFGSDAFFFFVNFDATGTNVINNWAFVNNQNNGTNDFEIRNYGTRLGGQGLNTPFRLSTTGQLQLPQYNTPNAFTDNTVTTLLGVQADGDVVQVDRSSLGGTGGILRVFEAYDNAGGSEPVDGGGFEIINLDTTRTNQTGFTLVNNAVGIPETGTYEINYGVSFANTNNNSDVLVETQIFLNGTTIDGSSSFTPLLTEDLNSSASKNIIIVLTAGDSITLRSQRTFGNGASTAIAQAGGTNITIKKLD